jgi:hypothetical protein
MIPIIRLNFSFNTWIGGSINEIPFLFQLAVFTFRREKTTLCRSNIPMEQPVRIKSVFLYVSLSYSIRNTNDTQVEFFHTNSGLLLKEVKKLTSFFHFKLLYLCFLWGRPSLCTIYLNIGKDGKLWMYVHPVNSVRAIYLERRTG